MQTKLSFYMNEIFKFIILFLLFFVWINFFNPNFITSVIISLIASAILSFILSRWFYKKQAKFKNTSKEKSEIKTISMQLMFNENNENLKFFSKVFTAKNIKNKIENNHLVLYPNTNYSIAVFIVFSIAPEIEKNIILAFNTCLKQNINKCLILTQKTTLQAQNFAKNIANVKIILQDETEIYNNYLKPTKIKPDDRVEIVKSKKQNFYNFLTLLLNKKNVKHYFWSAFIMVFASLFIRLSTYYIIFSSVFLFLALLSFYSDQIFSTKTSFLKKVKQPKNKHIIKTINTQKP